ncbi:MAG: hypothetical protein IPK32_08060 [Verrucomicrobiaceae bacterium]|nr:hypothetical protein [Verrucomicrobiaceae bacterium]
MNTDPSRREFLALASLGLAGIIPGCATTQSASDGGALKIDMSLAPSMFCKPVIAAATLAELTTPHGGSIERHLSKSGGKSVTAVYTGSLVTSKQVGSNMLPASDPRNQRAGTLQTTITYSLTRPGVYGARVHQTLNGIPCQVGGFFGGLVEPFSWFQNIIMGNMPVRLHSQYGCFIDTFTGIGAPEVSFSGSASGYALKLKPAGSRLVAALGRSVNVWNWKLTNRDTNRLGQSVRTIYDTMLSTEIPGQLESYSYRYEVGGDLIESSTGQLVSIR